MEFEIVIEEAVIESIYMHPLGGYKCPKGQLKTSGILYIKEGMHVFG